MITVFLTTTRLALPTDFPPSRLGQTSTRGWMLYIPLSVSCFRAQLLTSYLLYACVRVCTFFVGGQTAGPIGTKPNLAYLDPGSVLGESMSRPERRRRENEGAVGADRNRDGAKGIDVGLRTESP